MLMVVSRLWFVSLTLSMHFTTKQPRPATDVEETTTTTRMMSCAACVTLLLCSAHCTIGMVMLDHAKPRGGALMLLLSGVGVLVCLLIQL